MLEGRSQGRLGNGPFHLLLLRLFCKAVDAIDTVGIHMIAVVAQLIPHIEDEEEAKGNPDGQPEDVEEAISYVPSEIAESDEEEVFEHRWRLTEYTKCFVNSRPVVARFRRRSTHVCGCLL